MHHYFRLLKTIFSKVYYPHRVIIKDHSRDIWEVYTTRTFSKPWKKSIVQDEVISRYISPKTIIAEKITWTQHNPNNSAYFIDKKETGKILDHIITHQNFCKEKQLWLIEAPGHFIHAFSIGTVSAPKDPINQLTVQPIAQPIQSLQELDI